MTENNFLKIFRLENKIFKFSEIFFDIIDYVLICFNKWKKIHPAYL